MEQEDKIAISGTVRDTPAPEASPGPAGAAVAAVFDAAAERLGEEAPDDAAREGLRRSHLVRRFRELIIEEADRSYQPPPAGSATGATVDQLTMRAPGAPPISQVMANSPRT